MFPKFPNIFPIDPHLVYSKNLQGQFPVEHLVDALGVVMGMAFFRQVSFPVYHVAKNWIKITFIGEKPELK